MQLVSSRIWTRVAVSISFDEDHYTTGTSIQRVSRALLPAEIHYSQREKEAIIFVIKKFHKYVHGREFILQKDHHPLLAIFGSKKGIPTHTTNCLQRWATMLLKYSFKMEVLPSKEITNAGGLSKLIPKKYRTARGLFVAASHQTGLDTRSKTRRPIKVGIRRRVGRERVETRTLLVCAAHRLTWCNVSLMRQAVSRTQMWVRARMPGYGLN